MQTFKTLIIDPVSENRVELKKILFSIEQVEKTDEVDNFEQACQLVEGTGYDIIIVNGDNDEISAQEEKIDEFGIYSQNSLVIVYSTLVASDPLYIPNLIKLQARFYLPLPFEAETVVDTVAKAYNFLQKRRNYLFKLQGEAEARVTDSKTITIFSTKGGVGRTLFSVNTAISIRRLTGNKVALLDLDLQFGDVAIMMSIKPKKTIVDLSKEVSQSGADVDMETFLGYFTEHESGVSVLPAPIRPEESELILPEHVEAILKKASEFFHYIIVDTPNYVSESVLNALLPSDKIIVLLTMELPTIKNGKLMLELMQKLNIDKEKILLVMNRYNPKARYDLKDIETELEYEIIGTVPSGGLLVLQSVEDGEPFAMAQPNEEISRAFLELSKRITGVEESVEEGEAPAKQKRGLFGKGKK